MARCRSLSQPHDPDLSRMLVAYIAAGLGFMLLPGTLVGVVNLLRISSAHTNAAADPAWIQAHGHAQIFGWLGTFILGSGYYAIPRLRLSRFSHAAAWTTYGLWTAGVALRWSVGTWPWHWRVLFPLAGILELTAAAIFAISVYLAKPRAKDDSWRTSVMLITAAGAAMLLGLAVNAAESLIVALQGDAPVFPAAFNQRYLVLVTWGFIVPFVWGFSSRWVPPLLGLRRTHKRLMMPAAALIGVSVAAALCGWSGPSAAFAGIASMVFCFALRIFESSEREPKLRGVHEWTPAFLRISYAWSIVAAAISVAASVAPPPNGLAGASRHALTVGFFAAAVFTIGPRVLPAFFNVMRLWSTRVMAASLILLNAGCVTRVVAQIAAYGGFSTRAWTALTLSAIIEMTAVGLFALNMLMTLTTGSPLEAALAEMAARDGAAVQSGNPASS